jgi:poly(A) polymerase
LDPATADAIRAMASQITVVSAERIAEELRKLLTDPRRGEGLRSLAEVKLLTQILPEVGDVPLMTRVLERLPEESSFPLALAAVLRDVGKSMAGRVCQRLKLSNTERDRVEWLVANHKRLHDVANMRPSVLKPLLAHPGIRELLDLHQAVADANVGDVELCEQKLLEWPPEVLNPPPLLTGDDLMALGIERGPVYKRLLDAVRSAQLDGDVTTKEQSIELVRTL